MPQALSVAIQAAFGANVNVMLAPPAAWTGFQRAPVKSCFEVWTPKLTVALPQGDDHCPPNLRGESTRFASGSVNDADNVELGVDGLSLLDVRKALAWRASAQGWQDPVGTTDLILRAASPDHFRAEARGAMLRHDSDAVLTRAAAGGPGDDSNQAVLRQVLMARTELWRTDLRTCLTLVRGDTCYHDPAARRPADPPRSRPVD